jgi:hypothetical protein
MVFRLDFAPNVPAHLSPRSVQGSGSVHDRRNRSRCGSRSLASSKGSTRLHICRKLARMARPAHDLLKLGPPKKLQSYVVVWDPTCVSACSESRVFLFRACENP